MRTTFFSGNSFSLIVSRDFDNNSDTGEMVFSQFRVLVLLTILSLTFELSSCFPRKINISSPDSVQTQIIGGRPALLHEIPYQVAFRTPWTLLTFCGGTIIDDYWIMTAAHCFIGPNGLGFMWEELEIVGGATDLLSGTGITARIHSLIIHPGYRPKGGKYHNDIALVKTNVPLRDGRFGTTSIPLGIPGDDYVGETAVVSGFGRRTQNGNSSPKLYQTTFSIMSEKTCVKHFSSEYYNQTVMFCGGDAKNTACVGDSGGPVTVTQPLSRETVVIGVVSFGKQCDIVAYTRVSAFRDWIIQTVEKYGRN